MKRFLSVLLSIALLFSIAPISLGQTQTEDFLLASLSDIHYYPENLAQYKNEAFYTYTKGANVVYEDLDNILDATLTALEKDAKDNGLKYVVITGDLTMNGEYEGHRALSAKLKEFEESSGLTVLVTNGNHDINNPRASEFTTPGSPRKDKALMTSPSDFYSFYKDLSFDMATATYAEDVEEAAALGLPGAFSYSVSVEGGYRLIMIDAGKYTKLSTDSGEDKQETGGRIGEDLLAWIIAQAHEAQESGETPIAFTHWNISEINYLHGEILSGFVIDDGYKLQEIFADNGIHFAFSGHQHASDVDVTYSDSGEVMYSCIVPTLTQYPFMYRKTLFTRNEAGEVSARFDRLAADFGSPVYDEYGQPYPSPYYLTTGCKKQIGGNLDLATYLLGMVKNLLSDYIAQIQYEGSIIKFIKNEFGFDLRDFLAGYLKDGFTFDDTKIMTVDNVMYFAEDLDSQLRSLFFDNPNETLWPVIYTALQNIVSVEISDVPCTKYIDTYGFGDPNKGGTIGDLFFTVFVNMYPGNEDASEDPFLHDVLKRCNTVEFADIIFNALKEFVVDDIVIKEVLGKTEVRLDTLYPNDTPNAVFFVRVLYTAITSIISTELYKPTSFEDFITKLGEFSKLLGTTEAGSYLKLIEIVLNTGVIKYGKNTDEIIQYLLDTFLGETEKKAAAYQLYVVFEGIFNDEDRDHDVTYTYSGPVPVTPTVEDMQLPAGVNMSLGKDPKTSFNIKWMTKYSVTGTDIEIVEANKPFTGVPTTEGITAQTSKETVGGYGFDFGSFGIMNWSREVNVHSISITGLTPDTEYKYRIGDFSKGFVTEGTYTTSSNDTSFAFGFVSDTAGISPEMYSRFGDTLKAASEKEDLSFIVHGGNSVVKGSSINQWQWGLNSGRETLLNTPIQYAAGVADIGDNYPVSTYCSLTDIPKYANSPYGVYYSFDYKQAHFTVINANELDAGGTLMPGQLKWLQKDLSVTNKAWKIIIMNTPLYGNDEISPELVSQVLTLAAENHVNLILNGSKGAYTRTHVLSQGMPDPEAPVDIIDVNGKNYMGFIDVSGHIAISGCSTHALTESSVNDEYLYKTFVETDCPVFSVFDFDSVKLGITTYKLNPDGSTDTIEQFGMVSDCETARLGDLNGDGNITAADARLALRGAVGLENLSSRQFAASDLTFDKKLTAADARLVLRFSVGLEIPEFKNVYYVSEDYVI